ncbi:YdeI/OmpD-associated family protein [Herbidospora cretacea]|uniref:YdeI/OmpD-associated family protein n=1 Tax=Herbidospora cretacea TaxID=28444 RepID=UPI0007745C99|nr:YdeI/OmpD-associated family protein [Herbidospora cretacea]
MEPTFFETPDELYAWLAAHHATEKELWVGFHKRATGLPGLTWPESVDQALCFGWIDGVRKSLGPESYVIRFTPRKPRSTWSSVNINRIRELIELGVVHEAGVAAFEARSEDRSEIYSYEQRQAAELPEEYAARFQEDKAAWDWFEGQAPWYRRTAIYWVISAKKEETRLRRLATLIEDSAAGRRIKSVTRP